MSKAFTKESDHEPLDDLPGQHASASLPPGARNYVTPGGERRLREELQRLVQVERPALGDPADGDAETAQRRRKLNARIAELEEILQSVEVVPAPTSPEDRRRVVFGAAVTVRETRTGERSCYEIVGVDEVAFGEDRVSLHAPIARALINARLGDRVRFRFPAGEEELEIVAVEYR